MLDDGRSIEDDRGLLPLTLWLINPSDHDIGYFDLRVTSENREVEYYSDVQFTYLNNLKDTSVIGLLINEKIAETPVVISASLPKNNFGVVPAHGFLSLDIVFPKHPQLSEGLILLKTASSHNTWQAFRHSRHAPHYLRPKLGYIHSETKEFAQPFYVKRLSNLEHLDDSHNDTN